jgi:type IV pilus assembly protein PilY1
MIYAPEKDKDYWQDTSGDFFAVASGNTVAGVDNSICSWQTSGTCYWPTPASNSNANIDDLWHAAVNGHGTYFSASDAPSLAASLTGALGEIVKVPREGTAAAAASSNPNVTTTDNFVFSSSYISYKWIGELIRQELTASGTLNPQNWSAKVLLDCATTRWAAGKSYVVGNAYRQGTDPNATCYRVTTEYTSGSAFDFTSTGVDFLHASIVNANEYPTPVNGVTPAKVAVVPKTDRTIFTNSSSALIPFTWTDLGNAGLADSFSQSSLTPLLSQFCASGPTCLSTADKVSASGENLVNYLRGVRTNEGGYYRSRESVLGDIVSSEAKYVKTPLSNYTDTGFGKFKSDQATRAGTVYVGANDGMLHAFDGTTGQENWAYIPSKVVPNLYQLADKNYDTHHQYFVDGSPTVGDVYGPCRPVTAKRTTTCSGNEWRTILVGGLNRGGTSYYALDITDPADPIFLWEITDATMGYSFGNPVITKLKTGAWVVLLTSGYNALNSKGYLYVRNALDGKVVQSIQSVPLGLAGTLETNTAGDLAHIAARALSPNTDNTAIAAYGGDTQGNLWRFDINGDLGASGYDAHKLITLKDGAGKVQPITASPEVATVNGLTMVYVGTGMYLGLNDISNKDFQSFYGVIDRNDALTLATPRSTDSKFVKQVLTDGSCPSGSSFCIPGQTVLTSTSDSVDWTLNNGWYIDFLGAGERSVTDPGLALGTLLFTTIMPALATTSSPVCGDATGNAAGGSFLYALDYKTGGAVNGSKDVVAVSLGSIIATRPVPVELPDGTIVTITRGTPPEGKLVESTITKPTINNRSSSGVRRVSWRELTTQ